MTHDELPSPPAVITLPTTWLPMVIDEIFDAIETGLYPSDYGVIGIDEVGLAAADPRRVGLRCINNVIAWGLYLAYIEKGSYCTPLMRF